MNLITLEPPAAEPITLADCYLELRLTPDEDGTHPDDAMLTRHIASARTWAEQYTRRAFVRQKLRIVLDAFPCFRVRFSGGGWDDDDDYVSRNGYLELRRPPFIELDAIQYRNTTNALITVDPASYYVSTADLVPRLQFTEAFVAPETYRRDDAVQIDYYAGYPAGGTDEAPDYAANVPDSIRQAIVIGVQLLYDQIAPADRPLLENARKSLLNSFRVHSL